MFMIKTKARWLTHGAKTRVMLLSFLPLAAFMCAALCFFTAAMTAVYGAQAVFEGFAFPAPLLSSAAFARALPWAFFCAGALFTLCGAAARFTLLAAFYHRTDETQTKPARFLSLRMGARALGCTVQLFLRKCGWAALLLSPALLTAGTLTWMLRLSGLPPLLFLAGAGLTAGQTAAACAVYFFIAGRYCLTRYLLYLNPLLGVRTP